MRDNKKTDLLISIVNHNKGSEVKSLLDCIEKYCINPPAVVITQNVKEKLPFTEKDYSFFIKIINNRRAKGFGANHNEAFNYLESRYFCALNTDVYFTKDPFPDLIGTAGKLDVGVIAPLVYNRDKLTEDNARKLPNPYQLVRRRLRRVIDYQPTGLVQDVDWVAGFFMLFDSSVYKQVKGFNENYFLYCEDVDICSRIWLKGKKVVWNSGVEVYHNPRHSSHSNLKYLLLHVISLTLLFSSKTYYKRLSQKYF